MDLFRALDCRPVNAEIQVEASPLGQYLAHIELLTGELAGCLELDSLFETGLASLATLFGYEHAFNGSGRSAPAPVYDRQPWLRGVGSEVLLGHGMLGRGSRAAHEVLRVVPEGRGRFRLDVGHPLVP